MQSKGCVLLGILRRPPARNVLPCKCLAGDRTAKLLSPSSAFIITTTDTTLNSPCAIQTVLQIHLIIAVLTLQSPELRHIEKQHRLAAGTPTQLTIGIVLIPPLGDLTASCFASITGILTRPQVFIPLERGGSGRLT